MSQATRKKNKGHTLLGGVFNPLARLSLPQFFVLIACVCGIAATLCDGFVFNRITSQLSSQFETDFVARLQPKLETWAGQARPFYSGRRYGATRDMMLRALKSDGRHVATGAYDPQGVLQLDEHSPLWAKAALQATDLTLSWQHLPARHTVRFFTLHGHRFLDLSAKVDAFAKDTGAKLGSVRILVSLDATENQFAALMWGGTILVAASSLTCAFALYILLRLSVLNPLTRITDFVRYAAQNPDKVPKLSPPTVEAAQLRELGKAISGGLGELALRNKINELVQNTRTALQKSDENSFLNTAHSVITEIGLTDSCALFIVREDIEARQFNIEKTSEKPTAGGNALFQKETNVQSLLSRTSGQSDLKSEMALQFLRSGILSEWSGSQLLARIPLSAEADLSLVVLLRPANKRDYSPAKYESIVQAWMEELSRLYHQMRYQDLTSHLQLSQEMLRKWIQGESQHNSNTDPLVEQVLGFENIPSRYINGDFLGVFKVRSRMASFVVIGDVNGHELRPGLAAAGLVAILSDRFHFLQNESEHVVLEQFMHSINRYLWGSYHGDLATRVLAFSFNHESGQGLMACYGMPFPFLLSPQERKPMVVVPNTTQGLLGVSEKFDYSATPFQVLPGQVLFACSAGLLETEDSQGKRFEKIIQRGALSDLTQQYFGQGAQTILNKYVDCLRQHAGTRSFDDDITATVLTTQKNPYES